MAESGDEMRRETILHIFENRNIKGNTKDQILAIIDIVRFMNVSLQDCQYATDREWHNVLDSINPDALHVAVQRINESRKSNEKGH